MYAEQQETFQFQHGTIKAQMVRYVCIESKGFNSNMVRLKPDAISALAAVAPMFQFQHGTIKAFPCIAALP